MGVMGYIIGIFAISIIGYLSNRLIWQKHSYVFGKCEGRLLSFLLGTIIISLGLFIMGWLDISYSLGHVIFFTIVIIGVLLLMNFFKKTHHIFLAQNNYIESVKKSPLRVKIAIIVLSLWTIIKVIFGFISIINVPTYQDDAFGNRNYRTKVFYYQESLVLDKNNKDFLGQGYKQYPLAPYLAKMYLMKFTGERKEGYANVITFIFYIASLFLVFHVCFAISKNTPLALLGVYLLSSIPLFYIHGTNPYFDVFQAVYFLLAAYILYVFLELSTSWVPVGIYIGILGFTKSEGLIIYTTAVLGAYCLYGLFTRREKSLLRKNFGKILGVTILMNIPFIIFKLIYGLGFGNGDASVANTHIGFHPEIFGGMYNAFFRGGSYNILFLFLIILLGYTLISSARTKQYKHVLGHIRIFVYAGIIGFALVTFVYLTTFTFQYVMDQTGINRTMMQFCPLFIVVIISLLYHYGFVSHEGKK